VFNKNDIRKNINHASKELKKAYKHIDFSKDFLSLNGFDNLYKGIIVLGSYSIAAIVLPSVLNLFVTPLALLSFSIGVAVSAFAFFYLMRDTKSQLKIMQTYDISAQSLAAGGIALMALSPILTVLSTIIPALLGSATLLRCYNSLPEEIREEAWETVSNFCAKK
jgi:hypothetical protein